MGIDSPEALGLQASSCEMSRATSCRNYNSAREEMLHSQLPSSAGRSRTDAFAVPTWERWAMAVVLYCYFAFTVAFFGLASTDVVMMEGIIADGARQMEATGEFSVPRLHGEVYAYKPPLAYWMAFASFQMFGEESVWSLRFPFALCAVLMGLAVLWLVGSVAGPRAGLLSALASMSGVLMLEKLHLAEFDLPLTAGVGVGVAATCKAFAERRGAVGLWLLAYSALAFAFLAKGIPALMFFAPGLLAAALLTRSLREILRWPHLVGVLLFTVIVGVWISFAWAAEGWQAFVQPLAEGKEKGLTWNWSDFLHTLGKPLEAVAFFLPWTLALPAFLPKAPSHLGVEAHRLLLSAAGFTAAGLLMFMAVPSTESRYLLPLAVPVGTLCGLLLASGAVDEKPRASKLVNGSGLILGSGALLFALLHPELPIVARSAMVGLALSISTLALRGFAQTRLRSTAPILVSSLALLGFVVETTVVEPHRRNSRSQRGIAQTFEQHLEPGETLWTGPVDKGFHHSSLFFYLQRPVKTFHPGGEGQIPTEGEFVVLFSDEHSPIAAVLPFGCQVKERRQHRRGEIVLCEVGWVREAIFQ